jgi:hypothetical protein
VKSLLATSFGALLILPALSATSHAAVVSQRDGATFTVLPQRPAVLGRGAKPSLGVRDWQGKRRWIQFPTKLQHIVVIDMENRSMDNVFAAYYGASWQNSPTTQWQNVMNIANPAGPPALVPRPLSTAEALSFDPNHEHDSGFLQETLSGWASENFGCPKPGGCTDATALAYVPAAETGPYAQLVQNYASADEVFQANQGPSMPSHQYLIAGQSGALINSLTSPLGIASNPASRHKDEDISGNYAELAEEFADSGGNAYCGSGPQPNAPALNVYTGRQPAFTSSYPEINPPCETYSSGTILDEIAGSPLGTPPYLDWQFVAAQIGGYWASPTAVQNLYNQYEQGNFSQQPFAVDPNAYNFVKSLNGQGNPQRPFAALTYITPCFHGSDHPNTDGANTYGPQWLGTVVNAIGESSYWSNTAIIVTGDDWGGWYDHVPYQESANNPYGNPSDPNEWGFRVPLIVISPWVTAAGYVSHGPNGGTLTNPVPRSQSAILQFIENTFDLASLGTDDAANASDDALMDMFNFNSQSPLPFTPVTGLNGYTLTKKCQ